MRVVDDSDDGGQVGDGTGDAEEDDCGRGPEGRAVAMAVAVVGGGVLAVLVTEPRLRTAVASLPLPLLSPRLQIEPAGLRRGRRRARRGCRGWRRETKGEKTNVRERPTQKYLPVFRPLWRWADGPSG